MLRHEIIKLNFIFVQTGVFPEFRGHGFCGYTVLSYRVIRRLPFTERKRVVFFSVFCERNTKETWPTPMETQ